MNGGLKNIIKGGMLTLALKKKKTAVGKCDAKIDYKKDWIIDSGCTSHMTGDVEKLHNLSNVKMFKTTPKGKIPINQVGDTIISFKSSNDKLTLQRVRHVSGMRMNLISVSKLTSSGYFVLFGPQDVKIYRELEISEEPVMKGQMLESLYVFQHIETEN